VVQPAMPSETASWSFEASSCRGTVARLGAVPGDARHGACHGARHGTRHGAICFMATAPAIRPDSQIHVEGEWMAMRPKGMGAAAALKALAFDDPGIASGWSCEVVMFDPARHTRTRFLSVAPLFPPFSLSALGCSQMFEGKF
jgi:hypothetical protein